MKWTQTAIRLNLKAVSCYFYCRARRDSNPQSSDPKFAQTQNQSELERKNIWFSYVSLIFSPYCSTVFPTLWKHEWKQVPTAKQRRLIPFLLAARSNRGGCKRARVGKATV